jgi:hypothetical protein
VSGDEATGGAQNPAVVVEAYCYIWYHLSGREDVILWI